MSSIPKSAPTVLSLSSISQSINAGRWRTEAMRSHEGPRLLIISKGHGRITIAGLTRGFGPNNLIYIPAGTMYGYETGNTVFGQILAIPEAMASDWPEEAVHLRMRDVSAQKEFLSLMDGMERELAKSTSGPNRAAHYHLGLISVFFERQIDENEGIDPLTDTTSARLVAAYTDLIERSFRSGQGVAEYAASLGVTPTHLTRCCKSTCGKSALELLNDRRHFEACMLLRDTNTPVQNIATSLGYSSAAYFSRAFQVRSGFSPSNFRKHGEKGSQDAVATAKAL